MTHLRLVPPDGGGPGESPEPPDLPPASDTENLEARVLLQRLAERAVLVGTPGEWLRADNPDLDGKVVAVFDQDALPELAGLLLRRRGR